MRYVRNYSYPNLIGISWMSYVYVKKKTFMAHFISWSYKSLVLEEDTVIYYISKTCLLLFLEKKTKQIKSLSIKCGTWPGPKIPILNGFSPQDHLNRKA